MRTFLTTLTVVSILLAGTGCKKHAPAPTPVPKPLPPPKPSLTSIYTKKLAGTYIWNEVFEEYIGPTLDTSYTGEDTFAIDVINDTTVRVLGQEMTYVGSYYHSHSLYIAVDTNTELYFVKGSFGHFYTYLRYQYHQNKITFQKSDGGVGGYYTDTYTPK